MRERGEWIGRIPVKVSLMHGALRIQVPNREIIRKS
jgi:hypothetical protein